jgi:hypothetical protein
MNNYKSWFRILLVSFLIQHAVTHAQEERAAGSGLTTVPESVSFSIQGGFHAGPLSLVLHSTEADVEIRYTLDGSEPTEESDLYEDQIFITDRSDEPNNLSEILDISHNYANAALPAGKVFKGTVVRAAAFREDTIRSPVTTNTYFINQRGSDRYSLPVISLSVHPDSLFDHEKGIYVLGKIWYDAGANNHSGGAPANYNQRGDEWERLMHMELYEPDGTRGISQEIGARLHGGWSRAFPQKSFRLYSRSDYGTSRFRYQIFPELELDNFNRLILRNSGQDVIMTLFRDAYIQKSVGHMNFATMASRAAILFINGEYWGIYNIRERYDEDYLETHYGVESERVDLLTGKSEVKEGSASHYTAMLQYLQGNDIRQAEHFDHIRTMMDIDNFTDYYIAQIFARNTDWPHNNVDYWRYQTDYHPGAIIPERDGRWRWMMFDTDFGFGWQPENWPSTPQNRWDVPREFDRQSHTRNMIKHVTDSPSERAWSTYIFRRLLQNQEFRYGFLNRFADMLNSTYRPERMVAVLDSMEAVYAPEIEEHLNRWSVTEPVHWNFFWRPTITFEEWRGEVEVMREFAQQRPVYQWRHLMDFEGRDTVQITLRMNDEKGGYLRISTIDITPATTGIPDETYPWTGTYFRGVPVTVTAIPAAGYRFAGWEEFPNQKESSITIAFAVNFTLTARFEPDKQQDPPAHRFSDGPYSFSYWPANAEAGTYPDNMSFMYMDRSDPGLDAIAMDKTTGRYDLDSRTRINGLGGEGFAFINTSNEEGNPGYPGRRLGAAVLGLDTRGYGGIGVSWTGGTVSPNSRIYNLRLEYRVGGDGEFVPVVDQNGHPVEYIRNNETGHSEMIGPVLLPAEADDQPYIQLRWRYYFTGEREDDEDGSRSQLRVSDIQVTASPVTSIANEPETSLPEKYLLGQNYPNPFNSNTIVPYRLPESGSVVLEIFSVIGSMVARYELGIKPAGRHTVSVDAAGWASGMYIARLNIHDQYGRLHSLPPVRMTLLR